LPSQAIDPILAGAQVVSALQSITSRNVSPLESAVVSVTGFNGGDTFNVIPEVVKLQGTIRTFHPDVRALVVQRFNEITTGISRAMGCEVEVDLRSITPAVVNDPQVAERVQGVAAQNFPQAELVTQYQTMVSEDMAFIMQSVPGCYIMVGSANSEKHLNAPHHHPKFDFDEHALSSCAGLVSASIVRLLNG
jgi:amidohydrolase